MNTQGTYFQLGDGFEFILPVSLDKVNVTLKFMANSIYDLAAQEWKKYGITFYDSDYVEYQWRSAEMETRRKTFDDVPVLDYDNLVARGYLIQHEGSSAYFMNKSQYSIRRSQFVRVVKQRPTTINLGVDEELKAQMRKLEEREREQSLSMTTEPPAKSTIENAELGAHLLTPPRERGLTYLQLGDGFECLIARPHESVHNMLKMHSIQVYDVSESQWVLYRGTVYEENGKKFNKSIEIKNRSLNIELVPTLNYFDLVKAGYLLENKEESSMIRFLFDHAGFRRKKVAANITYLD